MRRLLLGVACALACAAPALSTGSLGISPLRLDLAAGAMSGTLVVHNESDAAADVLVKAQAWTQAGDRRMVLADTRDVVAYPPSFVLQPHEARTIRVGTLRAPDATERAYRVLVTELPPDDGHLSMVQFATRLSVPVFVGGTAAGAPRVTGASLRRDVLTIALRGATAGHALVRDVRVDAFDAGGRAIANATLPGWYVLGGAEQQVRGRLDESVCGATARLRVRVVDDDGASGDSTVVPQRTCSGS